MNRTHLISGLIAVSLFFVSETHSVYAASDSRYESFLSAAESYEAGEALSFESREDFLSFVSWYLTQYRLEDMAASDYRMMNGQSRLDENRLYDREQLKRKILHSFSPLSGSTDEEKIEHACRQIRSLLLYDPRSCHFSMTQALDSGMGVCWHFAKIAAVLLEESGIRTDLIYGSMQGIGHLWLSCRTESGTVWADPQTGIIRSSDLHFYLPAPYLSLDSCLSED